MIKLVQGCWSRGFKRHPLLQTSSPLEHQPRTYIEIGTMNGGTSNWHLQARAMPCPNMSHVPVRNWQLAVLSRHPLRHCDTRRCSTPRHHPSM